MTKDVKEQRDVISFAVLQNPGEKRSRNSALASAMAAQAAAKQEDEKKKSFSCCLPVACLSDRRHLPPRAGFLAANPARDVSEVKSGCFSFLCLFFFFFFNLVHD
jgi:hypothetical protein